MRLIYFAALAVGLIAIGLLTHFGSAIGLAGIARFWALIGLRPSLVTGYVLALILLLCVYAALRAGPTKGATLADIEAALGQMVDRPRVPVRAREWRVVAIAVAVFAVAFAVFMSKYAGGLVLKWPFDQLWHQAFVDYDAQWHTPFTSVPGNVLYQFGIRLPVNSRVLPVLGLSELFPVGLRVTASYSLLFIGMMLLFWTVGATFGLRPVARAIFAGLVALMTVIPTGIEKIFWLFPPNFFTTQFLLATWWGEAPMLALATVVAFYWIGRHQKAVHNALVAVLFALGCFIAVVGYPAGGFYFIPIIVVYCAVFLLTGEGRREWWWKGVTCAAIAAVMLALKVPQFFINLYGYTFASYFFDVLRAPASALVQDTFMVGNRGFDLRGAFVFFIAIMTAIVMASRGPKPLRRFSLAVLACELMIVVTGWGNAFSFRAPLLFSYAETAHSALWGSYFVLVVMAVAVVIDRRFASVAALEGQPLALPLRWFAARRRAVYFVGLAVALLVFLVWAPGPKIFDYPPVASAPLKHLQHELALSPGAPFRGRVVTIYAREGETPFFAIDLRYRRAFGNDFYTDLLPLGIPMLNESANWTSPVTFALLYRFFARQGDDFEKNFFWLDRFNAKMARLLGVRFAVSDAPLTGATLVSERSAGGHTLRLYRLDDTNLGQYSPTHAIPAQDAATAVAAIASAGFDPQKDVVVEGAVPSDLVPARSVSIVVDKGPRLHIRARSDGRSLVVLPFEFSRCLRLSGAHAGTDAGARLLPVNLQQTGLLFEKQADVSIAYRYGVMDSACRGADIARAKKLRLQDIVQGNVGAPHR